MRKITKGQPPSSFSNWVNQKPTDKNENEWFAELYNQKRWDLVRDLSHHNAQEQFYLCAYCCVQITEDHAERLRLVWQGAAKYPGSCVEELRPRR